jgi:deoxycytidine triphosphate deaminase
MILTDREIRLSLQHGLIKITLNPDEESYSSTTIDLTLGPKVREWNAAAGVQIRPGAKGYKYTSLLRFQKEC